jgi:hypothetical protein
MKKLLTVVFTMMVAGSLGFAQTSGDKKKAVSSGGDRPTESIAVKTKTSNGGKNTSPASKVALNPQPLPPGAKNTSPASKVALNPQPLPPGAKNTSPASKVELNPQPLPPRVQPTQAQTASHKKGAIAAKSKKGSAGTNTGSTTPK